MEERILDLGIGRGGNYLQKDPQGTFRVGMDNDLRTLAKLFPDRDRERTHLLLGDTSVDLPFQDQTFERIQALFPKGELLFGLCSHGGSLWPELHRVLNDEGLIEIFTSVSAWRTTWTDRGDWFSVVPFPHWRIWWASRRSGFESKLEKISREEVKNLGTKAAWYTFDRMRATLPDAAYRLRARKK